MRGDGDAILGLVGLLFGLVLLTPVLVAAVIPEANPVVMWGLPLLVGLGGGALAVAAFLTSRADKESKTGSGPKARPTAAFPTERAGAARVGGGMTEEGLEMTDTAKVARLCARLRDTDIFEALTDHELRLVVGIGEVRPIVAGMRLAHAGQRGENLYVILEGQVQLIARGGDGEVPVRMAHAGETLPLAVVLDPPVLVTSVDAITDGEVLTIPRLQLLELCQLQPMLGLHLYHAVAKAFERRYRQTLERLTDTLRKAVEVAVAGTELAN